jgi:Tol biopolymer transport system component
VSPAGLIGAILHVEPPALSKDDAWISGLVDRVVRKCLAKDPAARWQTAHDLRDELQWLAEASAEAGFKGVAVTTPRRVARQPVWASIAAPPDVTGLGVPTLSPDGRSLVFEGWDAEGRGDLWFRALGGTDTRRLPGTRSATLPFFAPDGRALGFFAEEFLKSLDISSGRVVTLADGCGLFSAGTWAGVSSGVILFSRGVSTGLMRVGGAGGSVVEVTSLDAARGDFAHLWPHFLPDGRHFLVVIAAAREPGIYLGSLESGVMRRLIETPHIPGTAVAYSPSGHLVYVQRGTLVAQPFDIVRFQVIDDPVRVAEDVFYYGPGVSAFSVSREGTLVFREDGGWPLWQPVWLDRTGREIGAAGPSGRYWSGTALFQPSGAPDVFRPCLSSDGRWLAIAQRQANQHPQIWIVDLQRGTLSPFTDGAFNAMPIWSPEGDRLLWGRSADSTPDVYVKSIAESGEGQRVMCQEAHFQRWPTDWSQSGRYVLVDQQSAGPNGWDLIVVDLESEGRRARPYLATPAMERTGVFSPDERWVAYASNVSGAMEVYLSTFPEHGRRWQISQGGGMLPFWAPNGLELYYVDPHGRVMAVRVREGDGVFSLSEPEALFRHESSGHLVVAPDGSRFLGLRALERAPIGPFTIVLDWPQIVRET